MAEFDYEAAPWMHVYPQYIWHSEATICGTRQGIEALRDALNAALDDPQGVTLASGFFASDGEGYALHVHVLPFGEFKRLAPFYSDDCARHGKGAFWPYMLPIQPKPRTTDHGGAG